MAPVGGKRRILPFFPERGKRANEEDDADRSRSARLLDLALAAGYVLRTKAEGWKLFCERMSVPPFNGLEKFPGMDRLQRALRLAEKAAFEPEGFLRWPSWSKMLARAS